MVTFRTQKALKNHQLITFLMNTQSRKDFQTWNWHQNFLWSVSTYVDCGDCEYKSNIIQQVIYYNLNNKLNHKVNIEDKINWVIHCNDVERAIEILKFASMHNMKNTLSNAYILDYPITSIFFQFCCIWSMVTKLYFLIYYW